MKKNAAKANIKKNAGKAPTKETVDTPLSECQAENPLECRFHGLKALGQMLPAILGNNGYYGTAVTDKLQGNKGYEFRINGTFHMPNYFASHIAEAFEKMGYSCAYQGKVDGGGHSFIVKKAKGKKKPTLQPAEANNDEVDLLDDELADLDDLAKEVLKDKEAKSNHNPFEGIDITEEDIAKAKKEQEEQGDGEITDEEIKDYLTQGGVLFSGMSNAENTISTWKNYATKGEDKGHKISIISGIVNALISKMGADNKISKALQNQLDNVDGKTTKPTNETASDEGIDLSELDEIVKEKESENSPSFTDDELLDFVNKVGWHKSFEAKEGYTEEISKGTIEGKPLSQGHILALKNAVLKVPTHPVSLAIVKTLNKLKSEKPQEETEQKPSFTDAELKDFMEKNSWPSFPETYKEMILKGTMNGNPLHDSQIKALEKSVVTAPLHPVALAITKTLNKIPGWKGMPKKAGIFDGGEATEDTMKGIVEEMVSNIEGAPNVTVSYVKEDLDGTHKYVTVMIDKPTGIGEIEEKDVFGVVASKVGKFGLLATQFVKGKYGKAQFHVELWPKKPDASKENANKGNTVSVNGVDESLMKPLEHDESKFPKKLTQAKLDEAIAHGKKAGGHGGLHTTIIEIDGKKYVCKSGSGKKSNIIHNGYNADMAYRAGGVYAPDAKLYEFGDGKTYKLSEFVGGKRLIDVWKTADDAKREEIRKELLKGFPLDVLFSNYDVLGTSPEESQTVTITGPDGKKQKTHVAFDNIILGDDGHAYRIDNDGAFAMTGTGGHKTSGGASFTTPVKAESWENWDEREWIDDFRTMRRNEKNLGIFDRYSTADIFLSAGNINLDKVVGSLPSQLQKALSKPLFEMKQMTFRAVNMALGGYKNNDFVSLALDASYEASKKKLREQCKLNISWNDSGFGQYKKHWGNYQPQEFNEPEPVPPQNPTTVLDNKLKNAAYTGDQIGEIILNAAKTINHHGGIKQVDKNGNVLGNGTAKEKPDYDPNAGKIAEWEKIDRDKLAELAKTDENAKTLLGLYDTIAYSKENGWKKPIGEVPTGLTIKSKLNADYKSPTEQKILDDMAGAIAEFKEQEKVYKKKLLEYEKRKSAHKEKEEAKALAAGGSPYHNFHDFANAFMEEGINTDGIAHTVKTNGIAPIENSMASQKGCSYAPDAVKWKVREMMALGYTPEQIMDMAKNDKLYNGTYYINCINKVLIPNKENWDRDMNSQAIYLGLNMVKMENEHSDLYDKKSGVVFLNRNIDNTPGGLTIAEQKLYKSSTETGWVGPHIDSAADCMQFEKNNWSGSKKQVYAVPLSRIVCCANNDKKTGGEYGYNGEQEYVGNLYMLPCWVYHSSNNLTWKNAIDEAKKSTGMQEFLKKLASRLAAFNTLEK